MSHETHHHHTDTRPTKTPFVASFWFVIILIGLFVGAVNFVKVMGHDEGGHGSTIPTREATSSQTLEGETGVGEIADDTTQHHSTTTEEMAPQVENHSSH